MLGSLTASVFMDFINYDTGNNQLIECFDSWRKDLRVRAVRIIFEPRGGIDSIHSARSSSLGTVVSMPAKMPRRARISRFHCSSFDIPLSNGTSFTTGF